MRVGLDSHASDRAGRRLGHRFFGLRDKKVGTGCVALRSLVANREQLLILFAVRFTHQLQLLFIDRLVLFRFLPVNPEQFPALRQFRSAFSRLVKPEKVGLRLLHFFAQFDSG